MVSSGRSGHNGHCLAVRAWPCCQRRIVTNRRGKRLTSPGHLHMHQLGGGLRPNALPGRSWRSLKRSPINAAAGAQELRRWPHWPAPPPPGLPPPHARPGQRCCCCHTQRTPPLPAAPAPPPGWLACPAPPRRSGRATQKSVHLPLLSQSPARRDGGRAQQQSCWRLRPTARPAAGRAHRTGSDVPAAALEGCRGSQGRRAAHHTESAPCPWGRRVRPSPRWAPAQERARRLASGRCRCRRRCCWAARWAGPAGARRCLATEASGWQGAVRRLCCAARPWPLRSAAAHLDRVVLVLVAVPVPRSCLLRAAVALGFFLQLLRARGMHHLQQLLLRVLLQLGRERVRVRGRRRCGAVGALLPRRGQEARQEAAEGGGSARGMCGRGAGDGARSQEAPGRLKRLPGHHRRGGSVGLLGGSGEG
jgi:hypothetical protein